MNEEGRRKKNEEARRKNDRQKERRNKEEWRNVEEDGDEEGEE